MEKLIKLESCTKSLTFGQVVNGRVNRVAVCVWSKSASEFSLVGSGEHYQGNMPVPEKYGDNIEAFAAAVQKAVDDGSFTLYAYDFPVPLISNGAVKAYKNALKPANAPMETIRRAWDKDNDPLFIEVVRAQINKSVASGKLLPVM
jgi:hypothetical protein